MDNTEVTGHKHTHYNSVGKLESGTLSPSTFPTEAIKSRFVQPDDTLFRVESSGSFCLEETWQTTFRADQFGRKDRSFLTRLDRSIPFALLFLLPINLCLHGSLPEPIDESPSIWLIHPFMN